MLAACAGAPPAAQRACPEPVSSGLPTQTRVEYVSQCMEEHGGRTYDNMYHCVCAVDYLGTQLTPEQFDQAQTFTYLFNTPGERGGEFRDPPQSEKLRTLLKQTKAEAAARCFPNPPGK
jgi:hypothetical protein